MSEATPIQNNDAAIQKLMSLPPDKLSEMKLYASKLRTKHPNWKPARLQRKVAEHFKVKLV